MLKPSMNFKKGLVRIYQQSTDSEGIGLGLLAVDAEILCIFNMLGPASAHQSPASNLESWRW